MKANKNGIARKLRVLVPVALVVLVGIGFAVRGGVGTFAAFGWQDISLLCPLGALSAMLASKTMIPRAVISVLIALVLMVLLGRAFCAWACPVPVVSKLRDAFSRKKKSAGESEPQLTFEERKLLKGCSSKEGCSSCAEKRAALDSRHFVLGGALASAAVFGFPVFCLICPIGLTFASVFLIMRLFGDGDVTWAVVAVPALLLVEVVFFRKWCSKICPLSALMSLMNRLGRTFVPTVDESACVETSKGGSCGRCAGACPEGIDPRNLDEGALPSECTRCRACVDACPAGAVSLPAKPRGER